MRRGPFKPMTLTPEQQRRAFYAIQMLTGAFWQGGRFVGPRARAIAKQDRIDDLTAARLDQNPDWPLRFAIASAETEEAFIGGTSDRPTPRGLFPFPS